MSTFHCVFMVSLCSGSVNVSTFHCVFRVSLCSGSLNVSTFHCVFRVSLCSGSLNVTTYLIGLRACSTQDRAVCSDAVLTIQVSAGDVITFCPPFVSVNVNESDAPGHVVVDLNSTKGDANITYTLQNAAQSAFRVNASTVRTFTVHIHIHRLGKYHSQIKQLFVVRETGNTGTFDVYYEFWFMTIILR